MSSGRSGHRSQIRFLLLAAGPLGPAPSYPPMCKTNDPG